MATNLQLEDTLARRHAKAQARRFSGEAITGFGDLCQESDLDRRRREREEHDDWLDSCKKDRAAEEFFARRDAS